MEDAKASTLRIKLKRLIDQEIDQIEQQLDDLDTEKRLNLLIQLLPFVLPKVSDTSYEINDDFNLWH